MVDQTIKATEGMTGSGHATKSDTLNRHGLIEHNIDGTHALANPLTNPSQPCFLVHPTVNQEDIAAGEEVTVIFGTKVFDIGNNFATNIFTAPVTGKYFLIFGLRIQDLDTLAGNYWVYIKTSNRTIRPFIISPSVLSADPFYWHISGSTIVDMDINDTAYIIINQGGGTVQTDIDTDSSFSGTLIC